MSETTTEFLTRVITERIKKLEETNATLQARLVTADSAHCKAVNELHGELTEQLRAERREVEKLQADKAVLEAKLDRYIEVNTSLRARMENFPADVDTLMEGLRELTDMVNHLDGGLVPRYQHAIKILKAVEDMTNESVSALQYGSHFSHRKLYAYIYAYRCWRNKQ